MKLKVLLIEPFFTASHKKWAEELKEFSSHHIKILSLSGHHWKWRMHGGAVTLAEQFMQLDFKPDVILVTGMLDLTTFQSLTKSKTHNIPFAIYFHENQITYPWSPTDEDVKTERDNHYGFINYASVLAADVVLFNSDYHKTSFLSGLKTFLAKFPDYNNEGTIKAIEAKSQTLHLGMNLKKLDAYREEKTKNIAPLILWNHRWEYDKNPELFFETLYKLKEDGIKFRLAVLGESYSNVPLIFEEAKFKLKDEIIAFGFQGKRADYSKLLWQADIYPVTSNQDFFGGSVVEAMYCNCYPIFPNRLAYPEHLSIKYFPDNYYQTKDELLMKLKASILNINNLKSEDYSQYVQAYDWGKCISKYDKLLEDLSRHKAI